MNVSLVDTGPLVAFLSDGDRHHAWAAELFERMRGPLLTCEAVVSEACSFASRNRRSAATVLTLVRPMSISVVSIQNELAPIAKALKKYASVPMSFADACSVRRSKLHDDSVVLTCDSDFHLYRRTGRSVIPALVPPSR